MTSDGSFSKWMFNVQKVFSSNISNMRRSVSSPDETLRRELKIKHAVEYF